MKWKVKSEKLCHFERRRESESRNLALFYGAGFLHFASLQSKWQSHADCITYPSVPRWSEEVIGEIILFLSGDAIRRWGVGCGSVLVLEFFEFFCFLIHLIPCISTKIWLIINEIPSITSLSKSCYISFRVKVWWNVCEGEYSFFCSCIYSNHVIRRGQHSCRSLSNKNFCQTSMYYMKRLKSFFDRQLNK